MEKKLTKKQLKKIIEHREKNPKKETTHKRRARILKDSPWWISRD
tara:strand:+ start:895 stop:1029 length:135 start_codon:yes stop_codon:yes gene_type:complete